MRVCLTVVAAKLLQFPFLEIDGGPTAAVDWRDLLKGEDAAQDGSPATSSTTMFTAIRTILLADMVMCLDNVIAVAATARATSRC